MTDALTDLATAALKAAFEEGWTRAEAAYRERSDLGVESDIAYRAKLRAAVEGLHPTDHTIGKTGAIWGWNDCISQVLALLEGNRIDHHTNGTGGCDPGVWMECRRCNPVANAGSQ